MSLLLAFALGFCGCATTHSAEADLHASSEKKEELTSITHSETKIAEHGGAFRIYRWTFGPRKSKEVVPSVLADERRSLRESDVERAATQGAGVEVDPGSLSEYEVEVHDGVDKTFMGSSDGQVGAEVATSSAVQADSKSASTMKPGSILGLSWGWWVLGGGALAAFVCWRILPLGEWIKKLRG